MTRLLPSSEDTQWSGFNSQRWLRMSDSNTGIEIDAGVVGEYLKTQIILQKDALDFLKESLGMVVQLVTPLVQAHILEMQARVVEAKKATAQAEALKVKASIAAAAASKDNGTDGVGEQADSPSA